MRYASEDDCGSPESAFLFCRFRLMDAWRKLGRRDEATDMFNDALQYRSRHGLFAEDVRLQTDQLCGNCSQTYSLVVLILLATRLLRNWEDRYWHD